MRRNAFLCSAAAVVVATVVSSTVFSTEAEAQVLRFSTTASGKIIGTGNALGLSKATNENGPGASDSIGTFISLGAGADTVPLDFLNPWPSGTTNDWTQNGSTANLVLPVEGEVLYAELLWGGSTNYIEENVTGELDTPVTLTVGASSTSITPDPLTALTIAQTSTMGFAANYYMRSANVTSFVQTNGGGAYSVSGVPATQTTNINSLNAAGWTIVVVVHDSTEPTRNMSVFVGGSFVDEDSQQDYSVSGFCTPPSGPFAAHVVTSAIEGDANLTGDQLLIAPTTAGPFVNLSGPNNPSDNFFCSQINGSDGMLDSSGTFGTQNQNAALGFNIAGGRQSWDVTTVDASSATGQLVNGQTAAVLRTITTGDSYVPTLAALAIDVNAPDFTTNSSSITTSVGQVAIGDSFQVTLTLTNTGLVTAEDVVLQLPLDAGLTLNGFTSDGASGDINGTAVTASALTAGVVEGDLAPGQTRSIVLDLTSASPPAGTSYAFQPSWAYEFQVCATGSTLPETFSQFAIVAFDGPSTTNATVGTAATAVAASSSGETSGSGTFTSSTGGSESSGGAGGGGGDGSGDRLESSGCGCAIPMGDEGVGSLGAIALVAAVVARRRRRSVG